MQHGSRHFRLPEALQPQAVRPEAAGADLENWNAGVGMGWFLLE